MLTADGRWSGEGVGVFSALVIVMAGGWAASRLLRTHPDPFACLVLGVTGAVAGMMAAGAAGFRLGSIGLFAASVLGGAALLGLFRLTSNVSKRRRNRNLVGTSEFESCGPSEETQENPHELDYRHHHRHHRRLPR